MDTRYNNRNTVPLHEGASPHFPVPRGFGGAAASAAAAGGPAIGRICPTSPWWVRGHSGRLRVIPTPPGQHLREDKPMIEDYRKSHSGRVVSTRTHAPCPSEQRRRTMQEWSDIMELLIDRAFDACYRSILIRQHSVIIASRRFP
jgi:hypothetical protein